MDSEQQVLSTFKEIASRISQQMLDDIVLLQQTGAERPSYETLMLKLKTLDKELTEKGVKLLETYKAATGTLPETLTTAVKTEIALAVEDFVKKL